MHFAIYRCRSNHEMRGKIIERARRIAPVASHSTCVQDPDRRPSQSGVPWDQPAHASLNALSTLGYPPERRIADLEISP